MPPQFVGFRVKLLGDHVGERYEHFKLFSDLSSRRVILHELFSSGEILLRRRKLIFLTTITESSFSSIFSGRTVFGELPFCLFEKSKALKSRRCDVILKLFLSYFEVQSQ